MRRLVSFAALFVVTFVVALPLFVFAQVATAPAAPTIDTVLQDLLGGLSAWKAGGAVAGLIALVNALVNATKLPWIDALLGKKFWLRPLVSVLGAFALALLGALAAGSGTAAAILAGIVGAVAGLASTGVHEVVTSFNDRVQTERAVGAKVVEALKVADASAATKVAAVKAQLDATAAIADEKARMQALAAWANANPPPSAAEVVIP